MAQTTVTFYTPRQRPAATDPEVIALGEWLESELLSIARQFQELHFAKLEVLYVAPVKVRTGMIVFADGVSWNPGGGAGTYEYRAGAWQKL